VRDIVWSHIGVDQTQTHGEPYAIISSSTLCAVVLSWC